MSTYITFDGSTTKREAVLHYVTVCRLLEEMDETMADAATKIRGLNMHSNSNKSALLITQLEILDVACKQRRELINDRSAAYKRVLEVAGSSAKASDLITQVAAQYGVNLTR